MSDVREALQSLRYRAMQASAHLDIASIDKSREEMGTQATSRIRDIREETKRLSGKAEGVRLVLSYIDEMLREDT